MQDPSSTLRKPDWLKVRLPNSREFRHVRDVLANRHLHTICQEARCPNITECFKEGTATFLILGKICTRNCRYCHVIHDIPPPLDPHEPERLTEAVKALGLKYIVITSVTRDDLPDGGATIFAGSIASLRRQIPDCRVEVLIPDFQGNWRALEQVMAAGPDVINHNIEVAPTLYPNLRPQGNYKISLELLRRIKPGTEKKIVSKSGFMVGFGEKREDILRLLEDLVAAKCERLTIGQYQQPTRNHWPVMKYYHPDEFKEMKEMACAMGFRHVESGPLVRSSYHAARAVSSTLHKQ
jgi:lipoic acid synthetase